MEHNQPESEPGQDTTRISPGPYLLPVPAGEVKPEAYQRAPTLMAGSDPGRQGAVRVWSPERWRLWGFADISTIASVVFSVVLAGGADSLIHRVFQIELFAISFVALLASVAALRRPAYLTTDDTGIALTPLFGPVLALGWEEIRSVEPSAALYRPVLDLQCAGHKRNVRIDCAGFSREKRKELETMNQARASLQPAGRFLGDKRHEKAQLQPGERRAGVIDDSAAPLRHWRL